DDQEETRPAAGMLGVVAGDGLDRKRLSRFVSMDRHVLGTMELEHAGDLLRPSDRPYVADEEHETDGAFDDVERDGRVTGGEPSHEGRYQDEHRHEEDEGDRHRPGDLTVREGLLFFFV